VYWADRTLHRAPYRSNETGGLRSILCPRKFDRLARSGPEAPSLSPAEQLLSEYKHFLVKERAISTSTVDRWSRVVLRSLTERFRCGPVDTGTLTASDIARVWMSRPQGDSLSRMLTLFVDPQK